VDEASEYPQAAFREAITLGLAGLFVTAFIDGTPQVQQLVIARDLLR
jgi:hypothetical protein